MWCESALLNSNKHISSQQYEMSVNSNEPIVEQQWYDMQKGQHNKLDKSEMLFKCNLQHSLNSE